MSMLATYVMVVAGIRVALFYAGIVVAVICAFDWAVRTRRINPFNRRRAFLPRERRSAHAAG